MSDKSIVDRFFESAQSALHPLNILMRLFFFILFALISATPYLIQNFNEVSKSTSGGFLVYLQALFSATWKGIFVGLSTLWDSFIRFNEVYFPPFEIGTIIYVSIVFIFAVWSFSQPIGLFFNVIDMEKKRKFVVIPIIVTVLITALIISPLAYMVNDGETIISRIGDGNKTTTITDVLINESNQSNSSITNSINMLIDGG